ncbi:MAG: transglycosylase domain-containing protein, partial [Methylococcales bacterium]
MQINKRLFGRSFVLTLLLGLLIVSFIFIQLVREEVKTSKYQARYLSEITKQLSFKVNPGPNSDIRYPAYGPYDERLGYALIPNSIARLQKAGFSITAQASPSPMLTHLLDYGLFAIYNEKTQAGLRIIDQNNQPLFAATYPAHGYPSFEAVPPLVLYTLLFIENRELLNDQYVNVNPAIEWDRLAFASLQMMARKLGADINVPGGSTLATQLEKYRHSENGYTNSIIDKFRQMASASVRAYLLGPDTREMRRGIALAYLNSMPLAATAKQGEVHGLGDGLSAWFDADFNEINKLLSPAAMTSTEQITPQQAQAYRQVLSILLSQRRPSYLLGPGYQALQNLTNKYLRLLADQGVISTALRDAALKETTLQPIKSGQIQAGFVTEKKTQSVLRTRLAKAVGVKSNYELDRLDLTVKTTLDFDIQQAVSKALHRLNETEGATESGIMGFRLLNTSTDLTPVIYSLMLFERSPSGNLLRIQTDNYDQPLDINEGVRLDLGSTSKLRTMVHYLELITDIYQQYQGQPSQVLKQLELHPRDFLSAWVIEQLSIKPDINLEDLLNLALDRKYSASPYESFFTGGGLHQFNNFDKSENKKIMSVRHALRDSTNLVFIRLMRDLTYHHLYRPGGLARWLESPDNPKRQEYLHRFADNEGKVYLRRFYAKYQGKSADEALSMLAKRIYPKASRMTMLYQAVYKDPEQQDINALTKFLKTNLPTVALKDEDIE